MKQPGQPVSNTGSSGLNIPTNIYPTSYSGIDPSQQQLIRWMGNNYMQNWGGRVNNAMQGLARTNPWATAVSGYNDDMSTAAGRLGDMPGQIERWRQAQPAQFMAGMKPMQDYYQPAMESMNQRGILNSSVTGNALGNIQSDLNRQLGQVVQGANSQAAQMQMQDIQQRPQQIAGIMSALQQNRLSDLQQQQAYAQAGLSGMNQLGGLIGQSKYSTQENPWAPWASMLPYMFGAY
jgi:hypothetical protein